MKKITAAILLVFSFCFLFGCEDEYKTNALIDDVASGAKAGYELVKVDGQEVKRIEHTAFVTRVPFVILKEGRHDFYFEKKSWADMPGPKSISMSASVLAGKMYRLEKAGDDFKLIIDEAY